MRIAWFTPFGKKSAIGQVSKDICEELAKYCDIDIWAVGEDDLIPTTLNVIKFKSDSIDMNLLVGYEHVIYNMGNYAGYHKDIWEVMQHYEGILILHDQTMHGFFQQLFNVNELSEEQDLTEYKELVKKHYGFFGISAVNAVFKEHTLSNKELAAQFSLLQPILEKAKAVFTHADFFADRIKNVFYGPIGISYLPYKTKENLSNLAIKLDNHDEKILVVSTGIVDPVKRIDKVANVLAKNPDLIDKIHYVVIGEYGGSYGMHLKELQEGVLKGCLYLYGYQNDETMNAFLERADICINLRYPNSEVCSLTLIEQMAHGKPVVVLNTGFYDEVPQNSVIKINLENEEEELEMALRQLITEKSKCRECGNNAKDFVSSQCTAQKYCERLLSFLDTVDQINQSTRVIKQTLDETNKVLKYFGFCQEKTPWVIDGIVRQMEDLFLSESTSKLQKSPHILGIWVGFSYPIPNINREGIMRFLSFLVEALMRNYAIDCEVWVYSFNEKEMELIFNSILEDQNLSKHIKIITEYNWKEMLNVQNAEGIIPDCINFTNDNLNEIARRFSQAECFIPAIGYLDNVIHANKKIFVPVHDLALHHHYDIFVNMDKKNKSKYLDVSARIENFARYGAFMFCNCQTNKEQQVLKYVKNIKQENVTYVYLPTNIPKNIEKSVISEKQMREKFEIRNDYLFYSTQIRPYKNVTLLIKALAILKRKNTDIALVLTGNPDDVNEVKETIQELQLKNNITCVYDVSEIELYTLYKYAAAVPVPTLFEGGFPWQACEALYMNTPVVLSNIAVTLERISHLGFTENTCGLELFDPSNAEELAEKLDRVLRDRDGAVKRQQKFRDKLLSYTWDDAAKLYYQIFFGEDESA